MRGADRDHWKRYQSRVDEQIQEAHEKGAFDNLPGKGKPLRRRGGDDENWWVREKLRREGMSTDALLPPSLRLRKEVERLPEAVARLRSETAVRETVADLNRRIASWLRTPTPPLVPLRRVDADDVVARWRASRPAPPARPPTPRPPPRRSWWARITGRSQGSPTS